MARPIVSPLVAADTWADGLGWSVASHIHIVVDLVRAGVAATPIGSTMRLARAVPSARGWPRTMTWQSTTTRRTTMVLVVARAPQPRRTPRIREWAIARPTRGVRSTTPEHWHMRRCEG